MTGKCKPGIVSRTVSTSPLALDLTVTCTSGARVPPLGTATQVVLPPASMASTVTAVGASRSLQLRLHWWSSRGHRPKSFRHSGCRSPPSHFCRSDCRPRLSRPRCRGEQRRNCRHPFRSAVFRWDAHRMFQTRTVRSVFHCFHRDSSFGLHEGARHLRLEGPCCRRR